MFEEISETMVDAPLFSGVGFLSLLMYFVLNTAVVFCIIQKVSVVITFSRSC